MDRSPGSAKDHIGYKALSQAAALAVARAALQKASRFGSLPGDHHFYVTFRTRTPGVQMADYLKDRFPEEMTIVIQHQYRDFDVHDDHFEIILSFSGVPQHLSIPFAAMTRFFDPSQNFGLQFEPMNESAEALSTLPSLPAPGGAPGPRPEKAADPEGTVVSLDAFRRK